eukprot:529919-Rhodomonas_salina.2
MSHLVLTLRMQRHRLIDICGTERPYGAAPAAQAPMSYLVTCSPQPRPTRPLRSGTCPGPPVSTPSPTIPTRFQTPDPRPFAQDPNRP